MTELLVIGAGLTGLMAAIAAARQGARTRIIATGMGSLLWTPGTIGVLGYLPGEDEPVQSPFDALDALRQRRPRHPFALLDAQTLRQSLDAFRELVQSLGLPYRGAEDGRNLLLPSPVGAPRPVFLAPAGQVDGHMGRPEPYLIVGFQALRDFYPTLIAENLTKLGLKARAEFLPIDLITRRRDFSPIDLARELDAADLSRLTNALKRVAKPGERIGLPAILGLKRHSAILATLREALDAPIFEIPTLPPSAPGMRLAEALRAHFELDLRGRMDLGLRAIDFRAENGKVAWVSTRASARPVRHWAQRFLLATGGILGGGIVGDPTGQVEEVIFHLPLNDAPQDRKQWFHRDFMGPTGHRIFLGGVRVNEAFQPVDAEGGVAYENLWAAGGLLADSDPIAERSLEGVAIATAFRAVQRMSEVTP